MYVFSIYAHSIPDECLIENGGCEHLCEKGGKCSCLTGYQLADDDKHCQGTAHMVHTV